MNIVVKPLWERAFRVNVYVADGFSNRISDSYFVKIDTQSRIVSSNPEMEANIRQKVESKIA